MSRGLGRTQIRILDAIAGGDQHGCVELATQLGISDRQMRRAAHALADRGLARVTMTAPRKLNIAKPSPTTRIQVNPHAKPSPEPTTLRLKSETRKIGGEQFIVQGGKLIASNADPSPEPPRELPGENVVDLDTDRRSIPP